MDTLFPPATLPCIPVREAGLFPVRRIFCVGRNYAAHAAEMGNEVDREAPFYFTKSAISAIRDGGTLTYPPGTSDLHHEVELVVALGEGGTPMAYGCGLDMTRRDLQAKSKEKRRPWDTGKDFEGSAVLAPMAMASEVGEIGDQRIFLSVNGDIRQEGVLSDMVWSVPEILQDLSRLYTLGAGDLVMTGTPAGVGAVVAGDRIEAGIDTLPSLGLEIGAR